MVRCQRCGQENMPSSRFCVGCGKQLSEQQPAGGQAAQPPAGAHASPRQGTPAPGHAEGSSAGAHPAAVPMGPPPGAGHFPASASPEQATHRPPHTAPTAPAGDPTGQALGGTGSEGAVAPSRRVFDPQLAYAETAPPLPGEVPLPKAPVPAGPGATATAGLGSSFPSAAPAATSSDAPDPLQVPRDAPRILVGFLVSYESNALGHSWLLHQGVLKLGRLGASNQLDIELPHATVSSHHATVYACAHPGRLVLVDQNSTNGTFVNNTALNTNEPRELADGDRVRFGLFTSIVKIV
jgi:hypothetical protein